MIRIKIDETELSIFRFLFFFMSSFQIKQVLGLIGKRRKATAKLAHRALTVTTTTTTTKTIDLTSNNASDGLSGTTERVKSGLYTKTGDKGFSSVSLIVFLNGGILVQALPYLTIFLCLL
jgi:hypothetical protein